MMELTQEEVETLGLVADSLAELRHYIEQDKPPQWEFYRQYIIDELIPLSMILGWEVFDNGDRVYDEESGEPITFKHVDSRSVPAL